MRKIVFSLATVLAIATASSAQWNPPPVPAGPGYGAAGCAPGGPACGPQGCAPRGGKTGGGCYGWNLQLFKCTGWWHKHCDAPKCAAPAGPTPGTLVYPQHAFVRGPRDFFMWEPGK